VPSKTPVSAIMTRSVQTLDVLARFRELRQALIANEIHHLPIVDGESVVGMISWRDLVRAYRKARDSYDAASFDLDAMLDETSSIEELMTKPVVTVSESDPIDRAIDLISDGHIHSVLVLDEDCPLAGIGTDKDIVAYLAD